MAPLLKFLRPWTFTASATPVILGAVLAYRLYGNLNPLILLATQCAVLAVNGAGNAVNTYFDYMREKDAAQGGRQRRPSRITHHHNSNSLPTELSQSAAGVDRDGQPEVDETQLVNYAAYLYGFGMACLWLLMWLSSARSEALAGLFFGGLSSSFIYTGGIGVKYSILGDLLLVFTFGPLAVLFSFTAQCGVFSLGPLLMALPLALSTEAILHSKHLKTLESDRKADVITLAVLLGRQGSYFFFTLLLFVPYLIFVILGTQYSLMLGLPLVSMPYAFQLERRLREEGPSHGIFVSAAKLNAVLSFLFIAGCAFANSLPSFSTQYI